MKTYSVALPITGVLVLDVEASSEEEAIDKAMDEATLDHLEEWEAHKKIVQGNVFYGNQNEAEAMLVDEDDEAEA